eukprot:scaffold196123_cov35-Tisochrysis_lutea.AAC.1
MTLRRLLAQPAGNRTASTVGDPDAPVAPPTGAGDAAALWVAMCPTPNPASTVPSGAAPLASSLAVAAAVSLSSASLSSWRLAASRSTRGRRARSGSYASAWVRFCSMNRRQCSAAAASRAEGGEAVGEGPSFMDRRRAGPDRRLTSGGCEPGVNRKEEEGDTIDNLK